MVTEKKLHFSVTKYHITYNKGIPLYRDKFATHYILVRYNIHSYHSGLPAMHCFYNENLPLWISETCTHA